MATRLFLMLAIVLAAAPLRAVSNEEFMQNLLKDAKDTKAAPKEEVDPSFWRKKQTYVNKPSFREAWRLALQTPAMQARALKLASGDQGVIQDLTELSGPKEGAFRVNLVHTTGAGLGSNQVYVHKVPAQFENSGDGFKYAFNAVTVPVQPFLAEDIDARFKKYKKSLGEYDDVKVELTKADNGVWGLSAEMSYKDGIKLGGLQDRIEWLFERSLWMFQEIQNAKEESRPDFMKKKLGKFSKAEVEFVLEGLSNWAMEEPEGKDGSWSWSQGSDDEKRTIQIDNNVDAMVMWVKAPDTTDANRDKVVEKLKEWVADEKPKKAAAWELKVLGSNPWLKVEYKYEGLTNKQVVEEYENFKNDFAKDFVKKSRKLAKKFS